MREAGDPAKTPNISEAPPQVLLNPAPAVIEIEQEPHSLARLAAIH